MSKEKQVGVMCRLVYTAFCVIIFCTPFLSAGTIYVDGSATGADPNGSSWTDAYIDIQSALGTAISSDEIWIAVGTYNPTTVIDRTASFLMTDGVSLYGGFAGNETTRDQRNWLTNETILSGDIGTIDDPSDNSYHVLKGADNATLDGFVITGGYSDGGGLDDSGGGMYNYQCSPTIINCVFSGNHADAFGGGVFSYLGNNPTILNCTFTGNTATSGGAAFHTCNNSIVENSVFSGNSSLSFGGGIYCFKSDTTVMNCSLSGNSANYGGAFYSEQSTPVVSNSIMWGNFAPDGSQIFSSADVIYCLVEMEGDDVWGDPEDNNINGDPNFVDDDLHIDPYSLCINMGDPNGNYAGQFDADGENGVRYQNVDMGAYEVFPIGGDLNTDERVDLDDLILFATDEWLIDADLTDFAMFGGQWRDGTGPIDGDLNGDRKVDMDDLLILVADDNWLVGMDLYDFSKIAGNWLYGVNE